MKFDILIAGVGGQGVILASRLLGLTSIEAGLHVTTAETIGMSQREGAVVSHVRIGDEVFGPLIPKGCADLILGMEPAEAVRNMPFLRPGGAMVVNTHAIVPASVAIGASQYEPEQIIAFIKKACPGALLLNATQLAQDAGNYRAANAALLGAAAAAGMLPFSADDLWRAMEKELPQKHIAVNKKAFEMAAHMVYNIKN